MIKQPYHRSPTAGRVAPISERRVASLCADAAEQALTEASLDQALACSDGRAKLQDDPSSPGEPDPYWATLFDDLPIEGEDYGDDCRRAELEGAL